MTRFFPNFPKLVFSIRPLLKLEKSWDRNLEQNEAFAETNDCIKRVMEVNHSKWNAELRKFFDTNRTGFGTVFKQREITEDWKPIQIV